MNTSQECNNNIYRESVELQEKFAPKKSKSDLLADSYKRISVKRGERNRTPLLNKSHAVRDCSSFLEFGSEIDFDGVVSDDVKLHRANFCRDRLCPMCAWRRTLKIFGQSSKIMDLIKSDYCFLALTLTVPNVKADELSDTITRMMNGYHKMMKYKAIVNSVCGYMRVLEITYNEKADTFHPHFHVMLAVPLDYFENAGLYIRRDDWLYMWQKAYQDDTITQVDIRRIYSTHENDFDEEVDCIANAVAEFAKYSVKDNDYITDDEIKTDYLVETFYIALQGRRLLAYGGCFREAKQKLNLEDAESDDVDLLHVNDEKLNPALAWLIRKYGWSAGVYKLLSERIEGANEHDDKSRRSNNLQCKGTRESDSVSQQDIHIQEF